MMNLTKMVFCAAFCVFFAAGLAAQEMTLTLDDAVALAAENNISLQQSQITLDGLKRAKNNSWNSVSPSLSLGGSMSFPMADMKNGAREPYDYNMSFSASVSFALSPSIYSSIQTARLNYENGLLTYDTAKRQIELNVRTAFYHLLYELEYIEQEQRTLDTAEQQYLQNRRKYESGQLSELDMLSSQVSYEQRKPQLEAAKVTYSNDLALFKQMLGIDGGAEVALSGSLDDALLLKEISDDFDTAHIPSVQAAENNVGIARAGLTAQRLSAWGPSLTASWSYGKSKNNTADEFSTQDSISVGVSIPLDGFLPWSSRGQSVASAKDTVKNVELALENEKTSAAVNVQNYVNQIRQGRAQLVSLQANIDLAERTYEMTERAYNAGTREYLSLQTASDSLFSARVSFAQQQYTLLSAVLNLEYLLGVPFGTVGK